MKPTKTKRQKNTAHHKSQIQTTAKDETPPSMAGIITLLLKDHRAMKELVSDLKEEKTNVKRFAVFRKLEKLVHSHMIAEETALLDRIKTNPKFEDEAIEGLEEHEIHRVVIKSIHRVKDADRRYIRMKSFCEILEHHLREEEEDLFPKYQKSTAKVTRRRVGREFLKTRKKSNMNLEHLGALDRSSKAPSNTAHA